MNSEFEILKKILENDEKTYIRKISNQTGFGIDYVRYICNCLVKKGKIKPLKGNRDWYQITSEGRQKLKLCGTTIKPKVLKKLTKAEKVIYYFPQKFKIKSLKNSPVISIKREKAKLIEGEEKKLNLGRIIEKTASFLSGIKRSQKEE